MLRIHGQNAYEQIPNVIESLEISSQKDATETGENGC